MGTQTVTTRRRRCASRPRSRAPSRLAQLRRGLRITVREPSDRSPSRRSTAPATTATRASRSSGPARRRGHASASRPRGFARYEHDLAAGQQAASSASTSRSPTPTATAPQSAAAVRVSRASALAALASRRCAAVRPLAPPAHAADVTRVRARLGDRGRWSRAPTAARGSASTRPQRRRDRPRDARRALQSRARRRQRTDAPFGGALGPDGQAWFKLGDARVRALRRGRDAHAGAPSGRRADARRHVRDRP